MSNKKLHQVENHEYVVPRGSKMEKEVIEGAVKICEPIQMKMLDPCFEPWIEHYYKKWKSKDLILLSHRMQL